jgi:hypothetical protein
MNIDVSKSIQELLYEHTSVIVPGLGGFVTSPKPAAVDYVQGVIQPPTKQIEFNPNLVINDGVLVHHIQKHHTITFEEARQAIEQFVEILNSALERREIVEIPQVGRLYKDYEQKVRFMPEASNFNAATFGLPPVQFSPVVREKPQGAATISPTPVSKPKTSPATATPGVEIPVKPAAPAAPAAAASPSGNLFQTLLPWLVLLSAVVIALSIFLMFGGDDSTPSDASVNKDRLNVKPKTEQTAPAQKKEAPEQPSPGNAATDNRPAGTPPATSPGQVTPPTEERPSSAASGQTNCYIIVHSFGKVENARKFERQLIKAGYKPETRQEGSLYRVGILFSYADQSELSEKVNDLARQFDSSPKVFEE